MRFIKKSVLLSVLGVSLLTNPTSSFAVIPATDYANLGQSIVNNLQDMADSEAWQAIYKSMMDQAASFASMSVDNKNNVWSNVIVRQGAATQEVQNIELVKMSTPAFNSEKTLGLSISVYCNEGSEVASKEADDKSYVSTKEAQALKMEGKNVKTFQDTQNEIIDRFNGGEGVCASPSDDSSKETIESAINPRALISESPDNESLSPKAEQAIYDYIDLVAPPYVSSYLDKSRSEKADETLKIGNAELEVFHSFPRTMLLKLMSKRSITNSRTGLSEITTLSEFSDQHYGGGSSSNSNISGKIMLSNLAVPSVVWRNLAVMKAFQVHMAVLKYKSSLDQEAIMAFNLAFETRKGEFKQNSAVDLVGSN